MLSSLPCRRALPAVLLVAMLGGCAGSTGTGTFAPPAASSASHGSPRSDTSDLSQKRGGRTSHKGHFLYVTNFLNNAVKILKDGSYNDAGSITTGIHWPASVFVDKRGNLYVANSFGPSVTEYAPGKTHPSFTYSANMVQPQYVAVDAHSDVFVGDSGNGSASGHVYEYSQGVNATVESCIPGNTSGGNAGVYGVAVDSAGDVFVDYRYPGGLTGTIAEYPGGLHGCHDQAFPITVNGPTGMALDDHNNLLVAAAQNGAVYEIEPPYTFISRTIGLGLGNPVDVKLSKDNATAFIADGGNSDVVVVDYASGSNIKVLGAAYGVNDVGGAVDSPNAVY